MLVKDTGEGQVSPRHLLVMSTKGPASVVQPCSWLMVLVLILSRAILHNLVLAACKLQ